ncbi:hypothetical protein MRX96_009659 [Rhipicephalus microplus]
MIAKVATILSLAAMAAAGAIAPHGGFSTTHRKQDDFGRYSFGYNVVNGLGARNSRYETGAAYGPVVGSYSLADIDGRARRVDYVADKLGFRAVGPIVPSAGFGGGYFPFAGGYGGYGGFYG